MVGTEKNKVTFSDARPFARLTTRSHEHGRGFEPQQHSFARIEVGVISVFKVDEQERGQRARPNNVHGQVRIRSAPSTPIQKMNIRGGPKEDYRAIWSNFFNKSIKWVSIA